MKTTKKLSQEAQGWHDEIKQDYGIVDEPGLLLLQTAMEAFDRMRQCQHAIEVEGQTILDRFN